MPQQRFSGAWTIQFVYTAVANGCIQFTDIEYLYSMSMIQLQQMLHRQHRRSQPRT